MNEVLRVIAERRSCRKFKDDPIPKEIIEQISDEKNDPDYFDIMTIFGKR